ncbi:MULTISPECIES: lipoprotein-releasing ABC transporter permease subunit [Candidatus Ichthyocystis]|uniref:lipoprotein-releasing ABC transporter permease subunit n=1 Tax=Candidatus Ichthyocystis TaxID=2929841 RepID=UPI000B8206AB|nr:MULTISPECIES: lipoprotein-releasing ABC transporter permease subunit [Ichthyocystis]
MLGYQLLISLRYATGKNSSRFVSIASITGIALGVSSLIVVLSVMNGFQEELRRRVLGVSAHLQVFTQNGFPIRNWKIVEKKVNSVPGVKSTAPFVSGQGLIKSPVVTSGVVLHGVIPRLEKRILDVPNSSLEISLSNLENSRSGIVLGSELARRSGVKVGSTVLVMVPQTSVKTEPLGGHPRIKKFHVVGIFNVGMYEYDANLAYIRLDDAQKLYQLLKLDNISGISVSIVDLSKLAQIEEKIYKSLSSFHEQYHISNWQKEHENLFNALNVEKRVMFVILTLIVAVAAFNIVSSLVMIVLEKQRDIAILSTLGATPFSIVCIFLFQGLLASIIGISIGTIVGLLLAKNIGTIVPFIEKLLHVQLLNKEIYLLYKVPSNIHITDIAATVITTFVLSTIATIYPCWKATRIDPAVILRD